MVLDLVKYNKPVSSNVDYMTWFSWNQWTWRKHSQTTNKTL